MVALPLFKLASLFLRHVSKYGANRIKAQAHDHPGFRRLATRYGQTIHQFQMRMSVALLRNKEAETRALEKAETPTVKTKEQVEREDAMRAKYGTTSKESHPVRGGFQSVWKRKFRPLPEAKAVDLFADVIGDGFILFIASALVIYEYQKALRKPDANKEKIQDLNQQLEELKQKEDERAQETRQQQERIATLENALRNFKDPRTKLPLLPTPPPTPSPPAS